jgi:hypothetical protein
MSLLRKDIASNDLPKMPVLDAYSSDESQISKMRYLRLLPMLAQVKLPNQCFRKELFLNIDARAIDEV